ncbi:hypothetical protein A2U01_0055832, partial [Trifolium medium]|nr:hypothetical protein [Trifolium medium]
DIPPLMRPVFDLGDCTAIN